ncbi:MAG: hypothetical protein EPO28_00145 [Saprospiraceae bacterium]|nr:MAG: hypothetical protein EPO28_00145 [Saprospiraceae bacterium]
MLIIAKRLALFQSGNVRASLFLQSLLFLEAIQLAFSKGWFGQVFWPVKRFFAKLGRMVLFTGERCGELK